MGVPKMRMTANDCASTLHVGPTAGRDDRRWSRKSVFSVIVGRIRVLAARSEGGSLVEFAVIAPLMLCMITGMFGFGFALVIYMQLNNAVDVAARTVAVIRNTNADGTTPDPCAAAVQAFNNSAPSLKAASTSFSFILNGASYPSTKTCSSATANVIPGKNVQVSVTYPYTVMVFGWTPVVMTLSAQTSELMQ